MPNTNYITKQIYESCNENQFNVYINILIIIILSFIEKDKLQVTKSFNKRFKYFEVVNKQRLKWIQLKILIILVTYYQFIT